MAEVKLNESNKTNTLRKTTDKLKFNSSPSPPTKQIVQTNSVAPTTSNLISTTIATGIGTGLIINPIKPSLQPKKKSRTRNKGSGTSSEEERWLDAIESGKLEQVDDELKKIKDPKLMTARQRAMYERGTDKDPSPGGEQLLALPTGYKEKVMTAEAIQKAQIKQQKRKQMADAKREIDKKKTMERLLKKKDSKISKNSKNRLNNKIPPAPAIRYRYTKLFTTITYPPNFDVPIKALPKREPPPPPTLCAICGELKKYNCSKTNIPLCSFKCYKSVVASLKDIMC